jgi:hypothetical protein
MAQQYGIPYEGGGEVVMSASSLSKIDRTKRRASAFRIDPMVGGYEQIQDGSSALGKQPSSASNQQHVISRPQSNRQGRQGMYAETDSYGGWGRESMAQKVMEQQHQEEYYPQQGGGQNYNPYDDQQYGGNNGEYWPQQEQQYQQQQQERPYRVTDYQQQLNIGMDGVFVLVLLVLVLVLLLFRSRSCSFYPSRRRSRFLSLIFLFE